MKLQKGSVLTMIATLVLLLGAAAQAQHLVTIVNVNVPFEFFAGKQQFPAGEYSVVSEGPYMLQLRNAKAQTVAIFSTKPVESQVQSNSAKLEFVVADGDHILSQVWSEGATRGQELFLPKAAELLAAKRNGTTQIAGNAGR